MNRAFWTLKRNSPHETMERCLMVIAPCIIVQAICVIVVIVTMVLR